MLELIALILLIPIISLLFFALIGNPGGFFVFGPVGVQIILLILALVGIIGVFDMIQGVLIAGTVTGTALMVIPFLS